MSVFLGTHPTAPAHRVLLAYPYNRELNEHIHAHGYIFDKAARKYWKALHGQATLRELEVRATKRAQGSRNKDVVALPYRLLRAEAGVAAVPAE